MRTSHLINSTHADAIRLGQLDIKNPKTLERRFLKQIQVFNSLNKIYFSNSQGGFIADNGVGMSEEVQQKIIEDFHFSGYTSVSTKLN
ncbi:MAG: hypothetical protein Fur006_43460 [Coleofasciculaceae cyanobacterium]